MNGRGWDAIVEGFRDDYNGNVSNDLCQDVHTRLALSSLQIWLSAETVATTVVDRQRLSNPQQASRLPSLSAPQRAESERERGN